MLLADIELIHMIRKGQLQYHPCNGLSPAEQLLSIGCLKNDSAAFDKLTTLMQQSRQNYYLVTFIKKIDDSFVC
ncbi:hypothetical protein ESOG_04682 [Escherichia coli E101]|nr:hypothetical protein ESOG_04682 [Escherichia coli E101]